MAKQRHREVEARLRALSASEREGRAGIDLANELAWELVPIDIVRARELALPCLERARVLSHERGEIRATMILSGDDFFAARYSDALEKARFVLERTAATGDELGRARMLLMRALVEWSLGDYESALEDLHACETAALALEETELLGWTLTSFGGIFEALADLGKASSLHLRAYDLFRSVDYQIGVGRALSGLGSVYHRHGRLDAALEQHLEAREIYRTVPSELSEARALNDMGTVYRAKKDIERARACLDEALQIRRKFGNLPAALTTLIQLGELSLDNDDPRRALELLNEAVDLAEEASTKPKLHQALAALSRAHEASGELGEALAAQRRSQAVKEAVMSDEATTRIKNLQIRNAVEKAEREAEIQRLRNVELADVLERLKQTQAQLVQSEKLASLGRLVAGVTHEMNTPVGVIASSMDVTQRVVERLRALDDGALPRPSELEVLAESTKNASRAASRVHEIVERLKAFSRLDRSDYQRYDLGHAVDVTLDLLRSQWPADLKVTKDLAELPELHGYPGALNQALMTLLMNAAEATGAGGRVTISTRLLEAENHVAIVVADDGRGMSAAELENLFEVGLSRSGKTVRMSTGLANVRATVVQMHGGTIEVESREGEGTRFLIELPLVAPQRAPERR